MGDGILTRLSATGYENKKRREPDLRRDREEIWNWDTDFVSMETSIATAQNQKQTGDKN